MSQSRLPVIEANRLRSILRPVLSPRSRRRSSGVGCCFHGRAFHESQAKKALIQARRNRFPKIFEREAEFHQRFCRDDHHAEPRRRLTVRQSLWPL